MLKYLILSVTVITILSGCNRPLKPDLKSPCVAAEVTGVDNGTIPCVKRKVNDNWLA